ncbi:Helix-loop-helix DNA-binding domain superfamily [Arabidopsis thaliana x Arabidopsis arenosa]|uniref:Helix-loop-helix DNA-binding domain superfamily n=1 Tax=Arabidopsis thaliana x Arabidopsis arenosa TaxID=1240361 RepID=A0A8T2AV61_9BRAS|nr:Helix-loop-helix DNA-binding domain superfamily [Arabidopsis thaliana x Arabidopsis arenosa]
MGDHHDFINSGSWWKVSSSSSPSSSSSMRASSIESGGSAVFHDHKLHHHDHSLATTDHHLQMIGLGLSSQSPVDQWNQSLLRGDSKAETSFGVMLQENLNLDATSNANANTTSSTSSYQLQESDSSHQHQALWRDPQSDFKPQILTSGGNRGFFLDHQFSPHGSSSTDSSTVTCQGFAVDNSSNTMYAATTTTPNSSSGMFHHQQAGGFGSSDQQQSRNHQQQSLAYSQFGSSTGNYDQMASALPSTWFLRSSPPKPHSPLRFSNNATFWNPAAAGNAGPPPPHDASSNFFPALQPPQIHPPSFDEQPKNITEIRDSSSSEVKRGGGDKQPVAKRAKSEAVSPSPAFKVRKEKMGDRIAALQQLVSPFGKTDAASVLSEAIEYIKFLHQQVSALSNPYMKSGASLQHQQSDHPTELEVSEEPDLRSRGLCLVPVSSTFPVTHDTTVDFWTPTFGGTFR